jgi:hypothetical protein
MLALQAIDCIELTSSTRDQLSGIEQFCPDYRFVSRKISVPGYIKAGLKGD